MKTEHRSISRLVLTTQMQEAISYFATREPADEDKEKIATLAKRMEHTLDRLKRGWPVSNQ